MIYTWLDPVSLAPDQYFGPLKYIKLIHGGPYKSQYIKLIQGGPYKSQYIKLIQGGPYKSQYIKLIQGGPYKSFGRNLHLWSTIGDLLSLETHYQWKPQWTSCWQTPDFRWRPPYFHWRPPNFHWRPHTFIGDPIFSLETPYFR